MRTRKEIEEIEQQCSAYQIERLNLEILLDIRDLLVEANRVDITSNEKPPLNDLQIR